MAVTNAPGAAGGLWTHTPVDWRGNDANAVKPANWPSDAVNGQPGLGTRPGVTMPGAGITSVVATPGVGQATVTWTTSQPGDSNVDIGATTAYGTHAWDPAQVTSHSVVVVTGTHGVVQHYRVSSHGGGYSAFGVDGTVTPT